MLDKVDNAMEKCKNDPAYRKKMVNYLNENGGEEYEVVDCIKVGKAVLHILDRGLPDEAMKGCKVKGEVDEGRRSQLQAHHTGTHLIFASCRRVLGPHVWQICYIL